MQKMVNPRPIMDGKEEGAQVLDHMEHVHTASEAVRLSAKRQVVVHLRWSPMVRIALQEAFHGTEIAHGIFSGDDPQGRRWLIFVR